MKYCETCKISHWDIKDIRSWVMKYGDKGKTFKSSKKRNKSGEQIDRWREIVERHGTRRE